MHTIKTSADGKTITITVTPNADEAHVSSTGKTTVLAAVNEKLADGRRVMVNVLQPIVRK